MPRITGKDAEGLMAAYAKVHAPKEEEVAVEAPVAETPAEDIQERVRSQAIQTYLKNKAGQQDLTNKANKFKQENPGQDFSKGAAMSNPNLTPSSSFNNNSTQKPVPTQTTQARPLGQTQQAAANIDAMRSPASGSRQVKPGLIGNLLPNHPGNTGGGGQTSTQTKPELSASPNMTSRKYTQGQANTLNQKFQSQINSPSNKFSNEMDNLIANTPVRGSTGGQKPTQTTGGNTPQSGGQQQRTVGGQGNRQRPVKTGGIQLGKSIRGGLGALGNLAGRAVGGLKQGVQSAASNIKQGVQAVGNALQNKGPIRGRSGANAAMKAKGLPGATGGSGGTAPLAKPVPQAKPAPQAQAAPQAKPAATARPALSNNSPAAKAGIPLAQRQQAATNNANFQANRPSPMERRNARLAAIKNKGRPLLRNNYDLIDDTINFLISEGYVTTESDALSIMSEPEFMESFNIGFSEVLNESSENNK